MQFLTLSTYQYQSAFLEQWDFPFPYDGFNSAAQNYNISHKIHNFTVVLLFKSFTPPSPHHSVQWT